MVVAEMASKKGFVTAASQQGREMEQQECEMERLRVESEEKIERLKRQADIAAAKKN